MTAEGKNDEANCYQNRIQHEDMTLPTSTGRINRLIANEFLAKDNSIRHPSLRDFRNSPLQGKNDGIFTVEGAELFKRDIPSAELHLLDTGHFALEEEVDRIGSLMHAFLDRTLSSDLPRQRIPASEYAPYETASGSSR